MGKPFKINGKVITRLDQLDQLTKEEKAAFARWTREQPIPEEYLMNDYLPLFQRKPEQPAQTNTDKT